LPRQSGLAHLVRFAWMLIRPVTAIPSLLSIPHDHQESFSTADVVLQSAGQWPWVARSASHLWKQSGSAINAVRIVV
ncbi:MAG TPA: hypothetical protein VMV94_03645, partial [Phycisphaerae bacterium]|nr:hypothetical protein [Phycisphaerae bacterium]